MAGALSGANQSSQFNLGLDTIQKDANRIIDNLQSNQNDQVDRAAEDKQYILHELNKGMDQVQQDWSYKMRDFTDQLQNGVKDAREKYAISSPKLKQFLIENVWKPFENANAAAVKDYQIASQSVLDNATKNIKSVYELNQLSQEQNKVTTDQLNLNN